MPTLQANSNVTIVIPAQGSVFLQGQGMWQFISPQPTYRSTAPQSINGVYGYVGPFDDETSILVQSGGADVDYEIVFPSGGSNTAPLPERTLSKALADAGFRERTVLFGDSMTDLYEQVQAPVTSLNYNRATGVLTIGYTAHQQATGWLITFWDRAYNSLRAGKLYQVTRITADSLSINIGANLADVPNGALPTGTASMRPQSLRNAETFVTWLNYVSGNRFNIVYNGAQSGDTTLECLERIWDSCLNFEPDVVIMQMPGINDAGDTTLEEIDSNRKAIIDLISSRVRKLILLTTTPVVAGEVRATLRIMSRVVQMNKMLEDYVKNKPNVIIFDAYRRIINPTDATGLAQATLLRTAPDLIHYSMRGGKLIADQLWAQISSEFVADRDTLPTSVLDSYTTSAVALTAVTRTNNVITATATGHGFFTGERAKVLSATGASELLNDWVTVTRIDANTVSFPSLGTPGAITGTISLSNNNNLMLNPLLTGAGTFPGAGFDALTRLVTGIGGFLTGAPNSLVTPQPEPNGFGQVQRLVMTATAANDRTSLVTNITDIARHVKPGRLYVFEVQLDITNVAGSNLTEIRVNMTANVLGVLYQTYALAGYTSGATLNSNTGRMIISCPPFRMPEFATPADVTLCRGELTFRCSAAGTAFTAEIGRINLLEFEGE
jgi:hypothetical protein